MYDYVGVCIRALVTALPLGGLTHWQRLIIQHWHGLNVSLELLLGYIKERSGEYRYPAFNPNRV
jgi:hypothetical protein